jgi:hypothetical protein
MRMKKWMKKVITLSVALAMAVLPFANVVEIRAMEETTGTSPPELTKAVMYVLLPAKVTPEELTSGSAYSGKSVLNYMRVGVAGIEEECVSNYRTYAETDLNKYIGESSCEDATGVTRNGEFDYKISSDGKISLTSKTNSDEKYGTTFSHIKWYVIKNDSTDGWHVDGYVENWMLPKDDPTPEPTAEPTKEPTPEPTKEPTAEPTKEPTAAPTAEPTKEPDVTPTAEPTKEPDVAPTAEPIVEETAEPTGEPDVAPTAEPTKEPATVEPVAEETAEPTQEIAEEPTEPTAEPVQTPAEEIVIPPIVPTIEPVPAPTEEPVAEPAASVTPDESASEPVTEPTVELTEDKTPLAETPSVDTVATPSPVAEQKEDNTVELEENKVPLSSGTTQDDSSTSAKKSTATKAAAVKTTALKEDATPLSSVPETGDDAMIFLAELVLSLSLVILISMAGLAIFRRRRGI